MATVITSECINCGACEPECPNHAIYQGGVEWELNGEKHPALVRDLFYIVPEKCSECVGFYDHEACAVVCPVDCCVPDPDMPETEEQLIARARQLHPETQFPAAFPSRFRQGRADVASLKKSETRAPVLAAAEPAIAVAAPPPPPPAAIPAAPSPPAAPAVAEPAAVPVAAAPAAPGPAAPEVSVTEQAPAQPQPETWLARELALSFAEAEAALHSGGGRPARRSWWEALRGLRSGERQGTLGQDGFRNPQFEEKLERERRYGEVYRLREENNGFFLEFEFARQVPPSAIKEELGVPDEMPDYEYELQLKGEHLIVKGRLADAKIRKIAAVSPAFPPDFLTHIQLPAPVAGFKHRLREKTLEVALVKEL